MWPFGRRRKNLPVAAPHRVVRRVIVGFIIGGAISSIIGSKLLQERRDQHGADDDTRDKE